MNEVTLCFPLRDQTPPTVLLGYKKRGFGRSKVVHATFWYGDDNTTVGRVEYAGSEGGEQDFRMKGSEGGAGSVE